MLTVDEILELARLGYGNEGSCFGVTDPSRLRPAFNESERPSKDQSGKEEKTVHIDTEEFMNHLKGK